MGKNKNSKHIIYMQHSAFYDVWNNIKDNITLNTLLLMAQTSIRKLVMDYLMEYSPSSRHQCITLPEGNSSLVKYGASFCQSIS